MDAALRQTVALLELVRQEEALLGWLDDCVAQLQAVRRARQTLLDFTDAELAEAGRLGQYESTTTSTAAAESVGSPEPGSGPVEGPRS